MADKFITVLMVTSVPVFLLGVMMLMVTRWITGPAPGDRKPEYVTGVRAVAWALTVVGFLVGTCLVLPGLAILWLATLAVIISMAYGKQVATQQYAMLAFVGAAAERSMPLDTAFAVFGQERGGWMRRRTAEIAYLLHQGVSLPEALEAVPGVLPPEAVPLVCVGYENGSLRPAIEQAITARNLFEPVWQSIVPKIGYVCILPGSAVGVVAFIMLTIMPKFQKIFRDFNMQLPPITRGVIEACRWGTVWLLLGVAWLFSVALLVYGVLRYAGSIRWDLPGMDWLARRRHTATVLDAIALAAQRQRPLGEALSTLAAAYPQQPIQRRLSAACNDLQAGGDDFQCLYARGLLGKTDLALLESARRNGNLAWAAQELADSNRRRFIYRAYALLQVVFPPIIIAYGLAMAAITAAVLFPLAELITGLSKLQ
jgi:type II secretory pathway component PulF